MPSNPFKPRIEDLRKITERAMEEIALKVIQENEAYAIELNLSQLDAGKDRLGLKLPPYKSAEYAKRKGRKIPDLKLTGEFWKAWTLDASRFPVKMYSLDRKAGKLVKQYGENIYNLSEVNTAKFARYVKPIIQKRLRELFHIR